jgi:hypothetical protein
MANAPALPCSAGSMVRSVPRFQLIYKKWSAAPDRLQHPRGSRNVVHPADGLKRAAQRRESDMAIDEAKLNEFLGKAVGDLGAAMSATLMLVGDRLGLYKALAKGALTSSKLAQQTGTNERYVREWLGNQGAGGYVQYDAKTGEWSLSPEQALCLADPNGPVDMPGA